MKRRDFFKGLVGAAAAPVVMKALPKPAENSLLLKYTGVKLDSHSWENLYRGNWAPPVKPHGEYLTAMQRAVLESGADEIFIGGGGGVGKTHAMLNWMLQGAVTGGPKWRGLIVASSWRRMDEVTAQLCELAVIRPGMNTPSINVDWHFIEFPSGARIYIGSPHREKYCGHEFHRTAFDNQSDRRDLRMRIHTDRLLSVVNWQWRSEPVRGNCDVIRHRTSTVAHIERNRHDWESRRNWLSLRRLSPDEAREISPAYQDMQDFRSGVWV